MATIALFNSSNIISLIIGFFLGRKISHCAIGFNYKGVPSFLHSTWPSVKISPRDDFLKEDNLVAEFEILPELDDEVVLAEKRVGEPYDAPGLIGYIFVLLFRKFGIKLHNPLASKSASVCSEFIIQLDVNNEIPEFYRLDPATVTPRDLFDICSNGKSFKKIS